MNWLYRFIIHKNFHFNGWSLFLLRYRKNENKYEGQLLTEKGWITTKEGESIGVGLTMEFSDLQELAGLLWDAKIKPIEFGNSKGEQEALKKHLEDMRKISFAKLNIELPEKK